MEGVLQMDTGGIDMTFGYIIEGIVGALICWFVCGGWYLLHQAGRLGS